MPTSTSDYTIHFGSGSSGPTGDYFLIRKYGSTDAFKIHDDGRVEITGKITSDGEFSVATTSSTSLMIAQFRGGSPIRQIVGVRNSGLVEFSSRLLLRADPAGNPPPGSTDGTIYWHEPSGQWHLGVYVGGTWKNLPAV